MIESSEIELAIKLGKARLEPDNYESKELIRCLKFVDIDLSKDPAGDLSLSKCLRAFTEHAGDKSLIKFIEECSKEVTSTFDNEWMNKYRFKRMCFFILGINYLYPASSKEYGIVKAWNETLGLNLDLRGYWDWARETYVKLEK